MNELRTAVFERLKQRFFEVNRGILQGWNVHGQTAISNNTSTNARVASPTINIAENTLEKKSRLPREKGSGIVGSARMGTHRLEKTEKVHLSLSTELSWKKNSAENLSETNRSITSTGSGTTTDQRTLSSGLGRSVTDNERPTSFAHTAQNRILGARVPNSIVEAVISLPDSDVYDIAVLVAEGDYTGALYMAEALNNEYFVSDAVKWSISWDKSNG